ncbi:MAG: hypothetical protein R3B70_40340 [Polyangiaceae bacterium]
MSDERREQLPTAYVLGELTGEEKRAFEAEMAESEELRAEVAEIREMADLLSEELGQGAARLPDEMRERIESVAQGRAEAGQSGSPEQGASGAPKVAVGGQGSSANDNAGRGKAAAKRPFVRRVSVWLAAAAVMAMGSAALMTQRSGEEQGRGDGEASRTGSPAMAMAPSPMGGCRRRLRRTRRPSTGRGKTAREAGLNGEGGQEPVREPAGAVREPVEGASVDVLD